MVEANIGRVRNARRTVAIHVASSIRLRMTCSSRSRIAAISCRSPPLQTLLAQILRPSQAHDAGNIFRSRAPRTLVPPAMEQRLQAEFPSSHTARQHPAAHGSCVRRSRAMASDALHIDRNLCRRPAPRRCGNRPRLPRQSSPISSTGCSTPVSLFAIMIVDELRIRPQRPAHVIRIDQAAPIHRQKRDFAADFFQMLAACSTA